MSYLIYLHDLILGRNLQILILNVTVTTPTL